MTVLKSASEGWPVFQTFEDKSVEKRNPKKIERENYTIQRARSEAPGSKVKHYYYIAIDPNRPLSESDIRSLRDDLK